MILKWLKKKPELAVNLTQHDEQEILEHNTCDKWTISGIPGQLIADHAYFFIAFQIL